MNASFNKWKATAGWNAGMGKYLQDLVLALEDGTIILAATVSWKGMDAVVSLHFAPGWRGKNCDLDSRGSRWGHCRFPSRTLTDKSRR